MIFAPPPSLSLYTLYICAAVSLSGSTSTGSSSDLSTVPTSKSKPTKAADRKKRPSSAEGFRSSRKMGAATVAGTGLHLNIHMYVQYTCMHVSVCVMCLCT